MQSNNFIFYKKIDSTQNEIWRLIESKTIKNKTLIMADIQTNGKVSSEIVKFLVIGIGINTEKMNFTDDIKNIATSIKKEFGIEVDRKKIITNFCEEFEKTLIRRIKK